MLFELTNALVTFQSYVNSLLNDYLNKFAVCCLDNILIFTDTNNLKKHIEYIFKVFQKLCDYALYHKILKCKFSVIEVDFLGFIISTKDIPMELIGSLPSRIS